MSTSKSTISSAEKRRFSTAVRKALRELDYEQFQNLVYWQGCNEGARKVFQINMKHLLDQLSGRPGLKIRLQPNPEYPLTPFGGLTLKTAFTLTIEAQNLGYMHSVGIKDGRLYISWARKMTPPEPIDPATLKRVEEYLKTLEERIATNQKLQTGL